MCNFFKPQRSHRGPQSLRRTFCLSSAPSLFKSCTSLSLRRYMQLLNTAQSSGEAPRPSVVLCLLCDLKKLHSKSEFRLGITAFGHLKFFVLYTKQTVLLEVSLFLYNNLIRLFGMKNLLCNSWPGRNLNFGELVTHYTPE